MLMNDYYAILQVQANAEPEVIEAAYRSLMRKYHPDILPASERNSPEVLKKVQTINEAYRVLRDADQRRHYDSERTSASVISDSKGQKIRLTERVMLVKCAQTHNVFKMILTRRQGWDGPFRVSRFESVDETGISQIRIKRHSLLARILAWFRSESLQISSAQLLSKRDELQDKSVVELLTDSNTISMSEIEWGGQKCPDCHSERVNRNGTLATWVRCGTCGYLRCVGAIKKRIDGDYSTCPWCGTTNRITRSVATGAKVHMPLRGSASIIPPSSQVTDEKYQQKQLKTSYEDNEKT